MLFSTEANQIVASSASGALAHWRRKTLDLKIGFLLLVGGIIGSFVGVQTFSVLKKLGQIDLVISLSYVFFLGIIGFLMLIESILAIFNRRKKKHLENLKLPGSTEIAPAYSKPSVQSENTIEVIHQEVDKRTFFQKFFKWKMSVVAPVILGFFVGFLAAIMGVGGGFIMVPAMIYILKIPTNIVVGTSLFQILFVTAFVTFLQAVQNNTVDIVLAVCLIIGGVVGAQIGARLGRRVKAEELRALLAFIVIAVCIKLGWQLFAIPDSLFTVMMKQGGH